jgi:hypothetical protein
MAIAVTCSCGWTTNLKDRLAGKIVKCPACGNTIEVPNSPEPVEEVSHSRAGGAPKQRAPTPVPRRSRAGLLWGMLLVGVLGAAALAYFFVLPDATRNELKKFVGQSPKQEEKKTADQSAPAYDGRLDQASQTTISGWAWDKSQPNVRVTVEIYDGDTLLGSVEANELREDLIKAGIGDGKHSFTFHTPPGLSTEKSHSISARIAGTQTKLANSGIPLSGASK